MDSQTPKRGSESTRVRDYKGKDSPKKQTVRESLKKVTIT